MKIQYWAMRGKHLSGPHESREAALIAFRVAFPFKGKPYEASAPKSQIMTGYGNGGPFADLRWNDAIERRDHAKD